jgi:hypothetical protein
VVSQAFADARESNVFVRWRPLTSRYLASHRVAFRGDLRTDPMPDSSTSLSKVTNVGDKAFGGDDHDAMCQLRGDAGGSTLLASTYASISASANTMQRPTRLNAILRSCTKRLNSRSVNAGYSSAACWRVK